MNEEELEWITNRHEGELMYFKSTSGEFDTLYIHEITIHNSLDPINWGYFNTSSKKYIATANIIYYFKNRMNGGILRIEKPDRKKTIFFSSRLIDGKWLYDVPLKMECMRVDGKNMKDIMHFDTRGSKTDDLNNTNYITHYSWSKKYGLVQYTFQDETTFSRIKIN